jgi:GNAT superfamily N-acetyltransferase
MLKTVKTNAKDENFIALVKLLDADLKESDGDEHDFYNQYNGIDMIKYAIVAYWNDIPVGCGAIKELDAKSMEVKRMFTNPNYRGRKIASEVLANLEAWAKDLGYERCVLETGKKQPAAIQLYLKSQYQITKNYGQYIGVENSVCFEKKLVE